MNLPGFTAEASLRRAETLTARAAAPAATEDKGRVVPQLGCRREGSLVSVNDGSVSGFYCCYGPWGYGKYCFSIRER